MRMGKVMFRLINIHDEQRFGLARSPTNVAVCLLRLRRFDAQVRTLSGGDRRPLAKELFKGRAMPLSNDARKIVTRGADKEDKAAA